MVPWFHVRHSLFCGSKVLWFQEVLWRLTGPWWNWDPAGGPVAADNGDGTYTFTFSPAPTDNMEYLLVLDGVQEDMVAQEQHQVIGLVHRLQTMRIMPTDNG